MQTITEQSLIASINADPPNIEIREVYADWLEEHGENPHGWRLLNACRRVPWQWQQVEPAWTMFGLPRLIAYAGFFGRENDMGWQHPERSIGHPDAFTCLRIAAECIIELEARGIDHGLREEDL